MRNDFVEKSFSIPRILLAFLTFVMEKCLFPTFSKVLYRKCMDLPSCVWAIKFWYCEVMLISKVVLDD